ncbi:MAG: polysaccharide biosynthesis protein [Lachnospiraceae bacterium]|nr:polysaccharide biosynthesis protein [Lachnospiraceae bacterium]
MGKKSGNSGFIKQAGILAVSGIIVRIIGILYRSPLAAIIGDEGNGYYGYAYNIYTNILLISSYSIPSAMSRVMAGKLARREYKSAKRLLNGAFIYVLIVGSLAAAFAWFAAPYLVVSNAVPVLRIFAPTIFLSGLLGVLRGFFQAHRSMVQTSVSQILEQLMNAAISVGAAWFFVNSAAMTLGSGAGEDTARAVRGAAGSAIGTGAGVLIALLFMSLMYYLNRDFINKRVSRDLTYDDESYPAILKEIFLVVTPFILSTFIYNCLTAVDQTVYSRIMINVRGHGEAEIATLYGIFSGKTIVLRNIPVAIASAVSAAVIPEAAAAWALNDREKTEARTGSAVRITMLVAIPCMVGLMVLSKPIVTLLFPQRASIDTASRLLTAIGITVILYSLSTITNGVLQSVGMVNRPVVHAVVALVIQFGILEVLLRKTDLNLYALVIADIAYSLIMCILNGISIRRNLGFRQEVKNTFLLPLLSSAVMGVAAIGVYLLLDHITGSNAVSLFAAVAVSMVVYLLIMVWSGAVGESELSRFPGGKKLSKLLIRRVGDSKEE